MSRSSEELIKSAEVKLRQPETKILAKKISVKNAEEFKITGRPTARSNQGVSMSVVLPQIKSNHP